MARKIVLCAILGLLALGAQAAGVDRFMIVALGGLGVLGLLSTRPRGGG